MGQQKLKHLMTSRLSAGSLPSQQEVDEQRSKLEIQKNLLTSQLIELISKHPEVQKNLVNLDQILLVENLPFIPVISNAMSSRKS